MFGNGGIVPDMYAKGFDAGLVCNDEMNGAEDAKRLRTFGETSFVRAATTYPGQIADKSGMVGADEEVIFTGMGGGRDIEREGSAAAGVRAYLPAIDPYRGVGADAFEPEKIAQSGAFIQDDRFSIERGAVQVTVTETAVAVIVVPIVRDVYGEPMYTVERTLPVFIDQVVLTGLSGGRKGTAH